MSEAITFNQLRVCLMAATECINKADTGSTESERIENYAIDTTRSLRSRCMT